MLFISGHIIHPILEIYLHVWIYVSFFFPSGIISSFVSLVLCCQEPCGKNNRDFMVILNFSFLPFKQGLWIAYLFPSSVNTFCHTLLHEPP